MKNLNKFISIFIKNIIKIYLNYIQNIFELHLNYIRTCLNYILIICKIYFCPKNIFNIYMKYIFHISLISLLFYKGFRPYSFNHMLPHDPWHIFVSVIFKEKKEKQRCLVQSTPHSEFTVNLSSDTNLITWIRNIKIHDTCTDFTHCYFYCAMFLLILRIIVKKV